MGRLLRRAFRSILFAVAALIACPVRFWPLDPYWDNTWVFALNYAAAQGLAMGRDVVWTTGPLSHLAFPQDIGNNLAHGLLFQGIVWAALIAILWDLYFRSRFGLWNLALFTVFFALSAPMYWYNYMGIEYLLLMGTLVLLVEARFDGGVGRFVAALAISGALPLIKVTAGMLAAGAIAGYLADGVIRERSRAWREVVLAATVPAGVAAAGCWLTLPSWNAFVRYVKGSLDLAGNYSVAMSSPGHAIELAAAAEVVVFAALLAWMSRERLFFLLLLTIPLFMSLKHGFVREDLHVVLFFAFAGLALGLIALRMPLKGRSLAAALLALVGYAGIWAGYVGVRLEGNAIAEASGLRGLGFALRAIRFDRLHEELKAASVRNFGAADRLDRGVRATIGDSPVAAFSISYSDAALDGLNLRLYPVVQKYGAYTAYLDGLNAAWVRNHGPRFLIIEWAAIDNHHPWVETPALWLEIYRWYNTRVQVDWSLLLERRRAPRFGALWPVRSFRMPASSELRLPQSAGPVFWTMRCPMTLEGRARKLLFRVPAVTMTIGTDATYRVVEEVLASPVLGNLLPDSLEELAALLDGKAGFRPAERVFRFGGAGLGGYSDSCEVELLGASAGR